MPGGVGGAASRGAPLSRSVAHPGHRPGGAFAAELEVLGFVTKSGRPFQPGVIQDMLALTRVIEPTGGPGAE